MIPAVFKAPFIDYTAIAPLIVLTAGALLVLLVGLARSRAIRHGVVPFLTIATFATTIAFAICNSHTDTSVLSGSLRIDDLTLILTSLFSITGITTVLLSLRSRAAEESGHGEYYGLLLFAALGMTILVSATNLVTLFIGLELFSISLYVLCASELKRSTSLESGLKYLIIGSIGSATLLYGLALLYGATGSTDFGEISKALVANGSLETDPLFLGALALTLVGLAFKASLAPFHQWTPDVYEGAPTAITGFMAVATKVAVFGVLIRLLDGALGTSSDIWGPLLATLAALSIVVGNVGALGQSSLKRMLAFSSIAQAGYLLAGVIVDSELGVHSTTFYLVAYLAMNVAAFAVIIACEHSGKHGDEISTLRGLGKEKPYLAWPMTIAMLSLAGFPATGGFIGKIYLIDAVADGGYTWLGVMIVVGSMISLAYYLRVVATMWMGDPERDAAEETLRAAGSPAIAGASPEADQQKTPFAPIAVALFFSAATIAIGIFASPLFDLIRSIGESAN